MTQIEREEIVERYLAGELSQADEANFFLHVAVDDELQRTLKAFQIMDRTIHADREVQVPERSRYREHIMAMLAVTPAMISGGMVAAGSNVVSSGTAAVSAGTGSTLAAAGGFGIAKMVVGALLGGSLLVGGGVMVKKWVGADDVPARSAPAVVTAPQAAPPAPAVEAPADAVPADVDAVRAETGASTESPANVSRVRPRHSAPARTTPEAEGTGTVPASPKIQLPPKNNTKPIQVQVDPVKQNK